MLSRFAGAGNRRPKSGTFIFVGAGAPTSQANPDSRIAIGAGNRRPKSGTFFVGAGAPTSQANPDSRIAIGAGNRWPKSGTFFVGAVAPTSQAFVIPHYLSLREQPRVVIFQVFAHRVAE